MTWHDERDYLEFVSRLGMTKHYASMQATRELIDLYHIARGHYVLHVGCGVRTMPCYLAKAEGCRVMGVGLLHSMFEQSRKRARAEGVEEGVESSVGDAQDLPHVVRYGVFASEECSEPRDGPEGISEEGRTLS